MQRISIQQLNVPPRIYHIMQKGFKDWSVSGWADKISYILSIKHEWETKWIFNMYIQYVL